MAPDSQPARLPEPIVSVDTTEALSLGHAHRNQPHSNQVSWSSLAIPAANNWLQPPAMPPPSGEPGNIYQSIPRRAPLIAHSDTRLAPTMASEVTFRASALRVFGRLWRWLLGLLLFALRVLGDLVLLRKDWRQRRWLRLRQSFEFLGGTFIKVGQQLSMRVDLLPIELCDELAKLLDHVPPFPSEVAIARIEAAIKRPMHEVFNYFDPKPIGSASVSCVYQAILKNGERVAVKVRRPHIGETMAADMAAMGLLFSLLELLTAVRQGFFKNLRTDLYDMLMEEMDFRVEARNQELFRRSTRDARIRYLDAPRVFFDLSSQDVLVSEFVSGIWLSELLAAVESSDEQVLARIHALAIDPKIISYRLLVASLFSIYDGMIFHADPHPANIIIQPHNRVVFIDFGSCGAYTDRERHLMQQLQYHMTRLEPSAMVQVALALQEPLPPVDIGELSKKLEMSWWTLLKAMSSKHAEWWERTSAGLWLHILKVTREYEIPMNLGMLKGIRSLMLYDTNAARLNHKLNAIKVQKKYWRDFQARKRRDAARHLRRRIEKLNLRHVVLDSYVAIKGMEELATQSRFRLQRLLDSSSFHFADQVAKASFLGLTVIQLQILWMGVTASWVGYLYGYHYFIRQPIGLVSAFHQVMASRPYWALVAFLAFRAIRQVQFRFADKEID